MTDTSQQRTVEIAVLSTKVEAGFAAIDVRLQTLEKRTEWLDGDSEQLRREGDKIAALIDRLPCSRHAEEIAGMRRRISDEFGAWKNEFDCVRQSETTGKIELAKIEAAQKARVEILEQIQSERRTLAEDAARMASARDKTWKRVSVGLGLVIAAMTPFVAYLLTT